MRLLNLFIRNFKSIREVRLEEIDKALILVGKNSTGKTVVLDAIRAIGGIYQVKQEDFNEKKQNIEMEAALEITEEDLKVFHRGGLVSKYKRFDLWQKDFFQKLPSCHDGKLTFQFTVNREGERRYQDGFKKNNKYIQEIFPKIYYIDTLREITELQNELLMFQEDEMLQRMRANRCMFDGTKNCNHCFQCIGLIAKKTSMELNAFETARLLEYKMYRMNLNDFEKKVNEFFCKNGGSREQIRYTMDWDIDQMFRVKAETYSVEHNATSPITHLGKGMRSIYILSLLEAYIDTEDRLPSIIMIEDPESFLHPKLQKVSAEIIYRLSKKNQVVFSTHSPNMLFNFTGRQIKQVVLDENYDTAVKEKTDIDGILDDLGYSANDLMNVSFVFIVEGKQDKSRLPLLLEKYYAEIHNPDGSLFRIAIITTNSCTNIKTYANLKYINKIYLRDQFLMIRDGDGQDADVLAGQLCRYYEERNLEDMDKLPKVRRENVLILKYYSFENYFLNPKVMVKLQIVESEREFYEILFQKWKDYLHRLKSARKLMEVIGRDFTSPEDMERHMEEVKIHLRGHNLYDIFYGKYRNRETELLKRYIDLAPREDYQDILSAIEQFIFFHSRRK